MSQADVADIAYAAGFFDGEGHVRISKHSRRCSTFTLQVTAVQATQFPLDFFKEHFGGTLSVRLLKYRGGTRTMHTWQSSSSVAEKFLRVVLPYLRVKKDEVEIALEFRSTFRPQHVAGGHGRMDPAILERRRSLMGQMQAIRKEKRASAHEAELNRRGHRKDVTGTPCETCVVA